MRLKKEDSLTLDIATRMIGDEEDMYIIHPGDGYHLYKRFEESKSVFLDFPDLTLNFATEPDQDFLRHQVLRSIAIREWYENGRRSPEPSRAIEDYEEKAYGRRLGRYVGAIESLYYNLEPGTIVMVSGPTIDDPVLFGELVGRPRYRRWRNLYASESLPTRSVRWLRKKPRANLSLELRSKFGTPNPIMQLERSLREEVVRTAYDQYVFENRYAARMTTHQADFSTLDDFNIQLFVNYVAGVLAAYELGVRDQELDFEQALAYLEDNRDLVPELAQNINSPGFQRLFNSTFAPLAIAALLTMALTPELSESAVQPSIANSASISHDRCAIEVAERVEGAMKLMKLDEWKRVCIRAREAQKHTGLDTSMSVLEVGN